MGVITEFNIDQFWEAEDAYEKMLERMKKRTKEIAVEFGKVNDDWVTKNIELFCIDEEAEVLVDATLVKNRNKVDKAKGVDEETIVFRFPMDWLFDDDYADELKKVKMSEEQQREKEYAAYLRLKEKFER